MQDQLPFSESKQDALLGHLVKDEKFFKQARSKIEPKWFIDAYNSKIWKAKLDFYEKFGRAPTVHELKDWQGFLVEDQATRNRIMTKINDALNTSTNYKLDALMEELTSWLHARIYFDGVNKSQTLYNSSKFTESYQVLKGISKEIDTTTFSNDHEVSFDNFYADIEQAQKDRQNALTFGNGVLDKLLLPDGVSGSLLPGDTTVLVAPTNVGKTTSVISIIGHNIRKGKSALLITHEGTEQDLKLKIWCNVLGCTKPELIAMYNTQEGTERMAKGLAFIRRYLTFVHYPKAGATIEEVESIVRRKQDERVAKYGKPYDLLVDDYPAKLMTQVAKGGHFSKRHIDEINYRYFVQLALEYNSHALLPIQANREGAKMNKRAVDGERRLLTGEDANESFGPIQEATNIITLNRDPMDEALGWITFYIDKSRSSEKGFAIVCKSDYGRAQTHSDKLGAVWYRGTSKVTQRSNFPDLFVRYRDRQIPEIDLVEI
jgi:replicative DNA helicase